MGSRGAIILVVILVICLTVLGFFLRQNRSSDPADPYTAIPTDASIIVESVDLKGLIKTISGNDGLFGELSKIKELETFNKNLDYLDTLLNKKEITIFQNESPALISFHITDSGKMIPLLITTVPTGTKLRNIREIINSLQVKNIVEKSIDGTIVLGLPYATTNKSETLYISLSSGILLFSKSEDLIAKALAQTNETTDIRSLPGFSRIMEASGINEDKLFIVFKNLAKLLNPLMKEGAANIASTFAKFASSAEGDIYVNSNGLTLNGFIESTDSSQFLYNFKNIAPATFSTYKILPTGTVLFETLLLPGTGQIQKKSAFLNPATTAFASGIRPFMGDEVTMAYIDIKGRPARENSLTIYELSDPSSAEMIFNQNLKEYYQTNNVSEDQYTFFFEPDDQTKIPVYNTPYADLCEAIIPGFLSNTDNSYFSFIDGYLVTGNSFVTISRLLYDNILKNTLVNDLTYRNFESTLPSRAGYMLYCVPSGIIEFLSLYLKEDIISKLNNNIISLKKIKSAGYQFASSNGMIYNSLSVLYKDEITEDAGTEWESLLDSPAAIKPFFFTNHNTGAKEIFIQDVNNNIYLLNSAGRVLWKTNLRERITGSVFMIDYYKNGKYQLLFAGKNWLHVIDRNGNYVERYPVKLRSPSTNPLALFDYEKNRDYRLFIAGEDNMIYAYDKTGSVVKGWNTFKTTTPVTTEIKFFRVSGKDYIVAADQSAVFFLDRSGNKRLTLKESVKKAKNSGMRLTSGSNPSLVFSSPDGTVNNVFFNGTVEKQTFRTFTENHSFDYFDVNADGFGDYVFIDEGKLYLYDRDKKEIFTRDLSTSDLGGPLEFVFSSSQKGIGVFDNNKNLIYLIDKRGDDFDGFPLRGASLFSITKLSERTGFNLIVGGSDSFLYNYKIIN